MRKPGSVKGLEGLGRVRLSRHFYLRDFLQSEIGQIHAIPNIPDDPDGAIRVGTQLCQRLLDPLSDTFGRIAIRSHLAGAGGMEDRRAVVLGEFEQIRVCHGV